MVCAGELPASVEMSPALSAALEGTTTMTLTPRTVVASNRDADEWDKADVAAPRSLSAYLAAPAGMVDIPKTLTGPRREATHFLATTTKDSAKVNARPLSRHTSKSTAQQRVSAATASSTRIV